MYYNYGKSLQHTGRFAAAIDAAVARREVWSGNGQRLFGVAVELAEIARLGVDGLSTDEKKKLHVQIITTLAASRDTGWQDRFQLGDDGRFAFLRDNEHFEQLMTSWGRRTPVKDSKSPDHQPTSYQTEH
jgi:hypothetical protein